MNRRKPKIATNQFYEFFNNVIRPNPDDNLYTP